MKEMEIQYKLIGSLSRFGKNPVNIKELCQVLKISLMQESFQLQRNILRNSNTQGKMHSYIKV